MKTERFAASLADLEGIARELLKVHPESRIFAFYGAMGAGKTTFIQVLCQCLGVTGLACSPSFALVNEYRTLQGEEIFHFDFYRIKNIAEALDIGYEHYFFSGRYCFIEWPDKIPELLPPGCVYVQIEETGRGTERRFIF